jgi:hypothetical protein
MIPINPNIRRIIHLNRIIVALLARPITHPIIGPMDLQIPNNDIPLRIDIQPAPFQPRFRAHANNRLVALDGDLEAKGPHFEHPVDADDEGVRGRGVPDQVVEFADCDRFAAAAAGGAAV